MKTKLVKFMFLISCCCLMPTLYATWTQDGSTATDGNWILRINTSDGVVKILGPNAGSGVLDISTIANDLGCTGVIVGNEAFIDNKNVTGLVLPEDLIELCDGAFERCTNLAGEISTTAAFKMSGYNAFDRTAITSAIFPNMTGSVGAWAFYECKQLKSVVLGDGITSFGEKAFFSCSALESVLPNTLQNVTFIANEVFKYCYALKSSMFLPNVREVKSLAFEGVACEEISMPSCTNMVGGCFYGSKIKKITHSPDVQLNGDVFIGCTELEELVPGKFRNLSVILDGTFQNCNSLKSLDFTGSTFTSVNIKSAQNMYEMKYLVLPETLTDMGNWSFERIKNSDVLFRGPKPTIGGGNVFAHNGNNQKLRNNIISLEEHIASWTNANSGVTFTPLANVSDNQKTDDYKYPTTNIGRVIGTVNFGASTHWLSIFNEIGTIILIR